MSQPRIGRDDRDAALAFAVGVVVMTLACSGPDRSHVHSEVPLLTVEPTLEIGVVNGADEYIFARIENVVRLGDGTIGVADAGATRISVYDESGTFLRRWARKGDGPGEFRNLARLYPFGPDSVMAVERMTARVSVFDLHGALGRELPGEALSQDSTFALDSWLHGRFWIEGALLPEQRAHVRDIIGRLPVPYDGLGYRSVRVADDLALWIREPGVEDGERLWSRIAPEGYVDAMIRVPDRFQPTHIRGDELLGVWIDENDVHHARVYRVTDAGTLVQPADWLIFPSSGGGEVAPSDEELMELMRSSIMAMARAQEIHYSSAMSYTSDVAELTEFEQPEGMRIDFVGGNERGWAAVLTHPAVDRVCGLAYGFDIPAGWTPGMITCGPAAHVPSQGG